jgi:hypothetical protein
MKNVFQKSFYAKTNGTKNKKAINSYSKSKIEKRLLSHDHFLLWTCFRFKKGFGMDLWKKVWGLFGKAFLPFVIVLAKFSQKKLT